MNNLKLRVFRDVVECESVTAAARRLIVSQPVVSAHVKALERELSARLIARQGRRVVPTDAGWALYNYACATLDATQRLTDDIAATRGGKRGQLHIGASPAGLFATPGFVFGFLSEHAGLDFSLRIGEHVEIQNWTLSGLLDFAYVASMELNPELVFEPLEVDETLLVAAAGHCGEARLDELQLAPFVSMPPGTARRRWEDGWFQARGLARHVPLALQHPELIKRAVVDGLGLGLLSRMFVQHELAQGTIVEIRLLDGHLPLVERGYVRRRGGSLSPLHQAFINHCRQGAGGALDVRRSSS